MSLIDEYMEDCRFIDRKRVDDGQGGSLIQWTDGAEFRAAITLDTSIEAKAAQVAGVTSVYNVTTGGGVVLEYHEVFRRLSDGKVFRVTSDGEDKRTPARASFQVSQVSAEEWRLPV